VILFRKTFREQIDSSLTKISDESGSDKSGERQKKPNVVELVNSGPRLEKENNAF
tara:strand:- start:718 stop:882 length:165 start_codon:yes stop_codon:yes gene_type:complete